MFPRLLLNFYCLSVLLLCSKLAPGSASDAPQTTESQEPATPSPAAAEPGGQREETSQPTSAAPPKGELEQPPAAESEEPRAEQETSTTPAPRAPLKCADDSYCLNGGTCVFTEAGQMICLCPEGFYGARCQTRNICKTLIADSLTGDQICAKIGRPCFMNDKFFRCSCKEDEYFVFKTTPPLAASTSSPQTIEDYEQRAGSQQPQEAEKRPHQRRQPGRGQQQQQQQSQERRLSYLAECRKSDKCLGVRCRQLSEVCRQGKCECNQAAGYLRDPGDGLCKLLDPCKLPSEDGLPVCGQAQCVATYNHELFRCVCPVGYRALKVGAHRSSTQCALITDTICDVPLLNKCQHICTNKQQRYECSCLPGYKPGARPGVDDHLCFFDEHIDFEYLAAAERIQGRALAREWVYKPYLVAVTSAAPRNQQAPDNTFTYDLAPKEAEAQAQAPRAQATFEASVEEQELKKPQETYIVRELKPLGGAASGAGNSANSGSAAAAAAAANAQQKSDAAASSAAGNVRADNESDLLYSGLLVNKMSAQDRCNMYCEENKICVLEPGSTDSYRCVCDRQGYVSVGDRCLDWCAAAEFSFRVLGLLKMVCMSGVCRPTGKRPSPLGYAKVDEDELKRLERESSWRPSFECDCSSSPLLVQEPSTKLCKLDFQAVLKPCLPGNVGYVDCVENKNAFCVVLHKSGLNFIRDLQKERLSVSVDAKVANQRDFFGPTSAEEKKKQANEKLYTCVCSPEKKFLVDKPRNKARCVDECGLLNVECGRFNRMCRAATIAPDDFALGSLVRLDPDGVRMNFRRTGCECLPGFNVGPSESVDFTLDDNYPASDGAQPAGGAQSAAGEFELTPENSLYPANNGIVYDVESGVALATPEQLRAKYININSRCLLDYDVVDFHASFKAPADFDPNWVKIRQPAPLSGAAGSKQPQAAGSAESVTDKSMSKKNSTPEAVHKSPHEQPDSSNSAEGDEKPPIELSSTTPAPADASHSHDETCDPAYFSLSPGGACVLKVPDFMRADISELHKSVVLVAQCDAALAPLNLEAYQQCVRYRYWIVQKLRNHFIDWRRVLNGYLSETFELMDGNIRLRVNKCESALKRVSKTTSKASSVDAKLEVTEFVLDEKAIQAQGSQFQLDPIDQHTLIDADIECELTLHSSGDEASPRYSRKVLLEKQLQKFIFVKAPHVYSENYYLMAPNILIKRDSFDQLAEHRKLFNPCKSDYAYCDKQTKCEMVDTVNFTCTCEYGYTPIGSRDIYYADSRKEVCEDIDECLFDVCKKLANVSTCINEIGDYRCQCNRHYTGDNKRFCTHVCNTIVCKHGKCLLFGDHHAFCQCDEGYKEADCSVQDPTLALRKANMIICGSIFTSILLLAITVAISLNSQLKKTKKKLKRIETASETWHMFEFPHGQPIRPRVGSKVSSGS